MSESGFITCQLTPKTTSVRVDYTSVANTTLSSTDSKPIADGAAGQFALRIITTMLTRGQGQHGNVVADHILQLAMMQSITQFDIRVMVSVPSEFKEDLLMKHMSRRRTWPESYNTAEQYGVKVV